MVAYELVLKGFDGSTDSTDHLIKWVWVESALLPKLQELCSRIECKSLHSMPEYDYLNQDCGFDAEIKTPKQLLKFLATC